MAVGILQSTRLIRGDSSHKFGISVAGQDVLDTDWTCRMVVTQTLESGDYLVDKMCSKDISNSMFEVQILPDESIFLVAGKYFLVFEVENLAQYFRREIQYELTITDGGIKNDGTYVRMLGRSVDASFGLGSVTVNII